MRRSQQAFSVPSKQTQSSNAKDELSSTASINASSTTLIPSSKLLASKPRDCTLKREQNSCYEHDNGLYSAGRQSRRVVFRWLSSGSSGVHSNVVARTHSKQACRRRGHSRTPDDRNRSYPLDNRNRSYPLDNRNRSYPLDNRHRSHTLDSRNRMPPSPARRRLFQLCRARRPSNTNTSPPQAWGQQGLLRQYWQSRQWP